MTDPTEFTNGEWVAYNTNWIGALQIAVFGLILFVGGLHWGIQGISSAIVGTEAGVTIVEGGMGSGALLGPFIASIGLALLTFVQYPLKKASSIRRNA